jgi:hypothetical protein
MDECRLSNHRISQIDRSGARTAAHGRQLSTDCLGERPVRVGSLTLERPRSIVPSWPGATLNAPFETAQLAARGRRPRCPEGFVRHFHWQSTCAGQRRERTLLRRAMPLATEGSGLDRLKGNAPRRFRPCAVLRLSRCGRSNARASCASKHVKYLSRARSAFGAL